MHLIPYSMIWTLVCAWKQTNHSKIAAFLIEATSTKPVLLNGWVAVECCLAPICRYFSNAGPEDAQSHLNIILSEELTYLTSLYSKRYVQFTLSKKKKILFSALTHSKS